MTFTLQQAPASDSELREMLLHYRRENWKGIQTPDLQQQIVEYLLHGDATVPLQEVAPYIELSERSRILDLGCGVGSFVVGCRRRGLQCFGVEPDRIGAGSELTSIQIARRRLAEPVFTLGVGEDLPFPDETFDLVTMNQVLEHVVDQASVVREAARVLRPGGVMYAACPNYLRFYEPHYKIGWLPLMPKWLGSIYLRVRGRDPVLIDQIQYTTNARIHRLLSRLEPQFVIWDLNREKFLRKSKQSSFAGRPARIAAWLASAPLIGPFSLRIALWMVTIRQSGCLWVAVKRSSPAQ
jgi:SAM-dependent methyltransferase